MAFKNGDGSITLSTNVDTSGISKGLTTIKKLGSMSGKAMIGLGAAAVSATVAITKMSVSAYADYEQLAGGIETLFKGSADKVKKYAEDAFMTAGLSKNEYMENVTSFSASLISSLGGDTEKAAEIANTTLVDISDNANKMGSTVESVTMAFQGFAKQQYMLLDNLKLGYGGTKTEMERLLKDAEAYMASQGKAVKYNIDNLADVYSAIHAIQEKLDIAGTTLKEAEKTITGSANMTKAAWQNVLTAISGGGDLDKAINNLVYSLTKYFENIVPVVQRAIMGIGNLIQQVTPMLVQNIAVALIQAVPSLVTAVYQMVIGMMKGLMEGIKSILSGKGGGNITADVNSGMEQTAISAENAAESTEQLADETAKAGKEAKKTLAGFDDLQILADNTASAGEGEGLSALSPENLASSMGVGGESVGSIGFTDMISEEMAGIMAIVGISLAAVGIILLCFGQIPWGLGFLVAGAVSLGVSMVAVKNGVMSEEATNTLTAIMAIAGVLVLAIGIILVCTGVGIPLGIGMIIAGAGSMVSAVALNWGTITSKVNSVIQAISENAGTQMALTAIGIIMLLTGNIPTGLALLSTVYASLKPEQKQSVVDYIKGKWEQIQQFWNEHIQPNIDFVINYWKEKYEEYIVPLIEDFKELAKELWEDYLKDFLTKDLPEAWDKVSEALSKFWNDVGKPALEWLGEKLLWLRDEVIVPLYDKVLSKLFDMIGTALPVAFDIFKATLKFVGNIILGFIDNISSAINIVTALFSGDWETVWEEAKNIVKTSANLMIEYLENVLNGISNGFEKVINFIVKGLNKIKIDAPDWVEELTGVSSFGINLKTVDFEKIELPRLAKGAVIPANKEFLAVLGDQKQGVNIEAPLQTIVDAFNMALAQNGGGNSGNTTVVLEIDGREFGHAVIEQGQRESRRLGTRMVMA